MAASHEIEFRVRVQRGEPPADKPGMSVLALAELLVERFGVSLCDAVTQTVPLLFTASISPVRDASQEEKRSEQRFRSQA